MGTDFAARVFAASLVAAAVAGGVWLFVHLLAPDADPAVALASFAFGSCFMSLFRSGR
jgi:hypothetical protein